jgi:hypothetical protein
MFPGGTYKFWGALIYVQGNIFGPYYLELRDLDGTVEYKVQGIPFDVLVPVRLQ